MTIFYVIVLSVIAAMLIDISTRVERFNKNCEEIIRLYQEAQLNAEKFKRMQEEFYRAYVLH